MSDEVKGNAQQYLTFTLSDEVYAVEVGKVKEVLEYTSVTKVPRTLDFMKGVINLRGSVVPVVDLRTKFGMPEADKTIDTSIVVMELVLAGESVVLGAIADSVKEVIDLDESQIEPSPKIGTRVNTEFIQGIGKEGEHFIIILDIDRIFTEDEIAQVSGGSAGGE